MLNIKHVKLSICEKSSKLKSIQLNFVLWLQIDRLMQLEQKIGLLCFQTFHHYKKHRGPVNSSQMSNHDVDEQHIEFQ